MGYSVLRLIGDEAYLREYVSGFSLMGLIALTIISILILTKGADWMIDCVVSLAHRTGIPKIIIGATIISLGTTTPEAVISVMAAWMGNPGLALGNGVGSIIADTGLIFGLVCVLTVVPLNKFVLNRTGWVQVGSATLLVLISIGALGFQKGDPMLHRWVGVLFLILLGVYMYMTYIWAKQSSGEFIPEEDDDGTLRSLKKCWFGIVFGLLLVIIGARLLVPSASEIARRLGTPEDVIACTMVAFGTSLPELITAITSVIKGHPEIMIGNVVGADVLNCLFVIGAASVARPLAIPDNFYYFHFPAMMLILYSFRFFILVNNDGVFKRFQGVYLLGIYFVYVFLQYAYNVGGV